MRVAADLGGGGDAVQAGHAHIHQHHVRAVGPHEVDRLPPGSCLGDDLEVGLGAEHRGEPDADQLLVVGDQDPHGHGELVAEPTGMRARTRNPDPVGPDSTSPP